MIVRNLMDKEVLDTTYIAHGGAIAQMVLDRRTLREIGFLACATLEKGKEIESHVDPMEEIYFIMSGEGEMTVGEDTRHTAFSHQPDDTAGKKWFREMPSGFPPDLRTAC